MIKRLIQFIRLKNVEKKDILMTVCYILKAEIVLKFFSYKSSQKLIFRQVEGSLKGDAMPVLRRKILLVERVCRNLPWGVSCLRKSISLRDLLSKAGIGSEIRIGVNKVDGKVIAHAWVQCKGYEIFKNGEYSQLQ